MLVPPALTQGDLIDIVAPSSPFDRTLAFRGMGWLRERYRIRFDPGIFDSAGYLAGDDDRRRLELNRALHAPDSKAVLAMRGGFGLHRIAPRVDWHSLRQQPKWLVGFSDATVFHVEATSTGVVSLHATMAASLGRCDEQTRSRWIDAIEHPTRRREWQNLNVLRAGSANGTTFGGNLSVIHACAAAGRLRISANTILFVEDVNERPYRVDRMLTTLLVGGFFNNVVGVVLGEFVDCVAGVDGFSVEDVVCDVLRETRLPIVSGFPMGHQQRNDPIPIGLHAQVVASDGKAEVIVG